MKMFLSKLQIIFILLTYFLNLINCAEKVKYHLKAAPKETTAKPRGGGGGKRGDITQPTKESKAPKTFRPRTTTELPASLSIYRYEHLVAMNRTTTTTEWSEAARIRERIERKHPRDDIIVDLFRVKFKLMTEKQEFKLEFNRLKKYVMKIGGNGTRFLPTFLKIAEQNKKYEEQLTQIDKFFSIWGLPKYHDIARRFTYLTKSFTPRSNISNTEKISKIRWFRTSVVDVHYQKYYVEKMSNPVRWEDLNIHTTGVWYVAAQNLPGYKHHQRKFNLPLKKQKKINASILYYKKLAEMRRLNLTGPVHNFTGTLIPTTTIKIEWEQPDVIGAINRYFNACSIGLKSDDSDKWWGPLP